jgi:hypothetical protein
MVSCKCVESATLPSKVYQLLAQGWWFSPGTPASSTTKTGRHDITEILLRVALKHQTSKSINPLFSKSTQEVFSVKEVHTFSVAVKCRYDR